MAEISAPNWSWNSWHQHTDLDVSKLEIDIHRGSFLQLVEGIVTFEDIGDGFFVGKVAAEACRLATR